MIGCPVVPLLENMLLQDLTGRPSNKSCRGYAIICLLRFLAALLFPAMNSHQQTLSS